MCFASQTHAQAPVLGESASFALFSTNGAVSNTGLSLLTGNVGTNNGSSTNFGNVDGVMHDADGTTAFAAAALTIAYNQLNAVIPNFFPAPLLGNGQVLGAGTYSIGESASLNNTLTLDGGGDENSVFIFQIQGAFSSSAGAQVFLTNGALACNVFWKIEGLVDLATNTEMKGTIVANNAAIILNSGASLEGRALSTTGAVTVSGVTVTTPLGCGTPILTGSISPELNSVACYTIFSGNGEVTNTGISFITGDVGTNVGLTTGFQEENVEGTIHPIPNPSTVQSADDLSDVYNYLNTLPVDIELLYPAAFGQNLVLTPHTYLMNAETALNGTVFLNAQGNADAVFVIKINGAFSTSTYASVILQNGAQAKNVFWIINGATNLNDYVDFKGTVIGNNGAVILNTGAAIDGRVLTTSGGITTFAIAAHMTKGCYGYVYENEIWTPEDPSGISTDTDNILVMDGTVGFTADTSVNKLKIETDATLEINHVLNLSGDAIVKGDLVFTSNINENGELGQVPTTSKITGNVTVQSYMSSNRSYRMVSSSVTTSNSVHANWQEGATSRTDNPAAGFGTHITGSTIDQENGFDGSETGNASMFIVNGQEFEPVANTDLNTLGAGTPYLIFVRGDRSIDLTDNTAAGETVLRAKGTLHTGAYSQTFSTVNLNDFVMFGNPYQSAVDINSVFGNSTNVNDGHYYVYDPTRGSHGAYVTVVLPLGTNTSFSEANQFLQPGQGAQFATIGNGASTIMFAESDKAPGNFTTTSVTDNQLSSDNMLTVQLFTADNFNNGGPTHDSFGIIFGNNLDNAITTADAVKPMNFYENFGRNHDGIHLSLERREMPQPAEVYPLYSSGYDNSNYTLKMSIDGLENSFLYLDDHFMGSSTLIEEESVYNFGVDVNDALSIATDRFSVRVEQRLGIDNNGVLSGARLYPNPLSDSTFYINAPNLNGKQVEVNITDMAGRQILKDVLDFHENRISVSVNNSLTTGVYMVTLKYAGEVHSYRLVKQ